LKRIQSVDFIYDILWKFFEVFLKYIELFLEFEMKCIFPEPELVETSNTDLNHIEMDPRILYNEIE